MAKLIVLNLLSIVLVAGGIYLAMQGISGWGWLVFLGAAQGVTVELNSNKDKKKKSE